MTGKIKGLASLTPDERKSAPKLLQRLERGACTLDRLYRWGAGEQLNGKEVRDLAVALIADGKVATSGDPALIRERDTLSLTEAGAADLQAPTPAKAPAPKLLEAKPAPVDDGETARLTHQLWEAESKIKTLEEKIEDWQRRHLEADRAAAREADELRQERDFAKGQAFGFESQLRDALRERDDARASAASAASGLDPLALREYLLGLSEAQWAQIGLSRTKFLRSRSLAQQAGEMRAEALLAVDSALGTPPPADERPRSVSGIAEHQKALAGDNERTVLRALAGGPLGMAPLVAAAELPRSTVYASLQRLMAAGAVRKQGEGRSTIYEAVL